jgi:putative FmdB family regulatory protein
MPICAYRCSDCGSEFSTLVMTGEAPSCDVCASADLGRRRRAVDGGGVCDTMGGCGCAGACPAFADA